MTFTNSRAHPRPTFNPQQTMLLRQRCTRTGCGGNVFTDFDSFTGVVDLVCIHCGRRSPLAQQQRSRIAAARKARVA